MKDLELFISTCRLQTDMNNELPLGKLGPKLEEHIVSSNHHIHEGLHLPMTFNEK